jgi:hypothetical protein
MKYFVTKYFVTILLIVVLLFLSAFYPSSAISYLRFITQLSAISHPHFIPHLPSVIRIRVLSLPIIISVLP